MATLPNGKGTLSLGIVKQQGSLVKREIGRPEPGPDDVAIDIVACGMCHSDVHGALGHWGFTGEYMAPGHEIAGTVRVAGANTEFKVGDKVGVGCMVSCCGACEQCDAGLEQHCLTMSQTYHSDWAAGRGHDECAGQPNNGGYSQHITVDKRFVFPLPDGISFFEAGPLLCAGITMFSPLNRHVLQGGAKKVGVVGFGGLGHMAVKLAVAMGADVTVYSRSAAKKAAAEKLGAAGYIVTSDEEAIKAAQRTQDVILDTVSAGHEIMPLISTLKVGGSLVLIGGVTTPYSLAAFPMLMGRYKVEGSVIGGVPETKEMLEFCAKHGVKPDITIIDAKDAAAAFDKLNAGGADPGRFVIKMDTLAAL